MKRHRSGRRPAARPRSDCEPRFFEIAPPGIPLPFVRCVDTAEVAQQLEAQAASLDAARIESVDCVGPHTGEDLSTPRARRSGARR